MRHIPKEGYLQVATGKRHQDEAIGCVQRIRPFLRNRPITLVTDQPDRIPEGFFDVIAHPQPQESFRDKILPL